MTELSAIQKKLLVNSEIGRVRDTIAQFTNAALQAGIIRFKHDLYISEHLAQRIVERGLQNEVGLICRVTKHFMQKIFYETTYTERKYVLDIRGLRVGIGIKLGVTTQNRYAVLATAYTTDIYDCDEVIYLK